ncbi:AzlD domain-containing protein [Bacillus sp. BRMEA1]|uniref:AzlD domain-containing protein n=1 Tax=Neobacillus endophyticus TaxID=2738405 RepID=UPI001567BF89|nr:AzlD domain-containing protein [Neobacillus endophyticus]NRD77876.1 AzlD domain-containing protein [Neobacillus endophyticus]
MEVRWSIFIIIIGMALVTFIPRVLPLMVLSRFKLPEWGTRWLSFIPISVMAALVGQEIFMHDGKIDFSFSNLEMLAAIPTFLMAVKTRSLLGTVVTGIISLMVLRYFM